jgi:hypothetical protein
MVEMPGMAKALKPNRLKLNKCLIAPDPLCAAAGGDVQ